MFPETSDQTESIKCSRLWHNTGIWNIWCMWFLFFFLSLGKVITVQSQFLQMDRHEFRSLSWTKNVSMYQRNCYSKLISQDTFVDFILFSENAFHIHSCSLCKLMGHGTEIYFHMNVRNWSDMLKSSIENELKAKACNILECHMQRRKK